MAKKIITIRTNKHGYLLEENVPSDWNPYVAPHVDHEYVKETLGMLCKALGFSVNDTNDLEIEISIGTVQ